MRQEQVVAMNDMRRVRQANETNPERSVTARKGDVGQPWNVLGVANSPPESPWA